MQPPGSYGGPPPGYGPPPPGYGPPLPKAAPPKWAGVIARIVLAFGVALGIATAIGGYNSERLGETLCLASSPPLGFGVVATLLTGKRSTGGAGFALGLGCLGGFMLSLLVIVFFIGIFPKL